MLTSPLPSCDINTAPGNNRVRAWRADKTSMTASLLSCWIHTADTLSFSASFWLPGDVIESPRIEISRCGNPLPTHFLIDFCNDLSLKTSFSELSDKLMVQTDRWLDNLCNNPKAWFPKVLNKTMLVLSVCSYLQCFILFYVIWH